MSSSFIDTSKNTDSTLKIMSDINTLSNGSNNQAVPAECVYTSSTVNLTASPTDSVIDMPKADTSTNGAGIDSDETSDIPPSAPPSYNSLFGRMRSASTRLRKTEPEKEPINPVPCMIVAGILMLIPIAHVVIGSLYLHFCRLEKMVPTFLVVFGVFAILAYICCIVIAQRIKSGEADDEDDAAFGFSLCFVIIIGVFLVAWLITGSVFLYGSYTTWDTDISLPTYCIPTLYHYAFWTTTIFYSLIGLLIIVGICGCCIKVISSA